MHELTTYPGPPFLHFAFQNAFATWMGEESGGEGIPVYVWLSPLAVHLKLSQHYLSIGYIPIQNKMFFLSLLNKKDPAQPNK